MVHKSLLVVVFELTYSPLPVHCVHNTIKIENHVEQDQLASDEAIWSGSSLYSIHMGVQWLSAWVLDSRPRVRRLEPHRLHCDVVLEQDTFILA